MKTEALVAIARACSVRVEWLATGEGEEHAPGHIPNQPEPPAPTRSPESAPVGGALIDQTIKKVDDLLKNSPIPIGDFTRHAAVVEMYKALWMEKHQR